MGNNISSKAAKIMKIDGEIFKFKTPAKVFDVIKDYPDHVLLDSGEFLRYSLRAKPLDPQFELKPRKIYLLVQLPKFPKALRRVRSGVPRRRMEVVRVTRRSISDVSIMTQSTASTDSNESESGGTRVKIRLPKALVERITAESRDEGEVGERILRLCLEDSAAGSDGDVAAPPVVEEERESGEEVAVDRSCFSVHALCSPCIYQRKYKRLPSI